MNSAAQAAAVDAPRRGHRWGFWLLLAAGLLVVVFARPVVGWWAQRKAAQELEVGAVDSAEQWLARAARFRPGHPDAQLLLARIYRLTGDAERWRVAVEAIDPLEADAETLQLERRLGALRWAHEGAAAESRLATMTRAGVDLDEAATAILFGQLASGDEAAARRTLERWEAQDHRPSQLAYMRGIYWQRKGDHRQAEEAFRAALEAEPRHVLARLGLAEALENQNAYELASAEFRDLFVRWPANEAARIGYSRSLRRQGRGAEAARLWESLEPSDDVSREVAIEVAETHYQLGRYEEAVVWYEQAELIDSAHYADTLRTAASAFALAGRANAARSLFEGIYANQERSRRLTTLGSRVATDQSDTEAAAEMQRLAAAPVQLRLEAEPTSGDPRALYARHCAACHGEEGEGNGRAAANLFPRPRDLRHDRYRLVSSSGTVPSEQDIIGVLRRGIPGTAMPPFPELSDAELRSLAELTLQMRREGLGEEVTDGLREHGEEPAEETVARIVRERMDPGAPIEPVVVPATAENLSAGRAVYRRLACGGCHGPDGRGAPGGVFFDEQGLPSLPRDLVGDPLKGGSDAAAVFARLRLGMPGTSHPANPSASDEELAQLAAYCVSLGAKASPRTNLQRERRANERALEAL